MIFDFVHLNACLIELGLHISTLLAAGGVLQTLWKEIHAAFLHEVVAVDAHQDLQSGLTLSQFMHLLQHLLSNPFVLGIL